MKNKIIYEVENTDTYVCSLKEAIATLRKILDDESNYNYKINKDNKYCILKNTYESFEENAEIINCDQLCDIISISEYRDMDYEQKEKFFSSIKEKN